MGFKIVSGGQTGVDRAALDVGLALGLDVGGWCPRDRWAEDGRIPDHYPLTEVRSRDVHARTHRNVETSTASLVITRGAPMGGVRLTVEYARSIRRPLLVVDTTLWLDPVDEIVDWLDRVQPRVLNVAGPKESGAPGIGRQTAAILSRVLERAPELPLGPRADVAQDLRPS